MDEKGEVEKYDSQIQNINFYYKLLYKHKLKHFWNEGVYMR